MKEKIITDAIRFALVAIIIVGLLYFFYPLLRYQYTEHDNEDRPVYRIDRFTGEVSRLRPLGNSGWFPIANTKSE